MNTITERRPPAVLVGPREIVISRVEMVAESGRLARPSAAACANFVHELDDVWLGSRNRPGAVIPPSWFKFGEFRQNPASDKKFRQNLSKFWPKSSEILTNSAKIGKKLAKISVIFKQNIEL